MGPLLPGGTNGFQGKVTRSPAARHGSKKMNRMTLIVQAYDLPRSFSWGMDLGAGWIFRGVREQWPGRLSENSCRYHCQEKMSDVLGPLVVAVLGNHLRRGRFKAVRELQDHAETPSNSGQPVKKSK